MSQNASNKIEPIDKDNFIAKLPKESLKNLFYLLVGKPDSQIKLFSTPIHLAKEDIFELNRCVTRKLETHSVEGIITTVKVGYDGSLINEFGTWIEFYNHHWEEPNKIEEIVLKWDFLINIEGFTAPQRHTLLFRVSRDFKAANILQLLASGNSEQFEQIDMISSPAFCRVDFINLNISKELINVITDWYNSRKSPILIPSVWYWFKKRRQSVATAVDQLSLFSWSCLLASSIMWLGLIKYNNSPPITYMFALLFVSVYSLRPISKITHTLASRVFKKLASIEGSRVVFEFTSGDKKRISDLKLENSKLGRAFFKEICFSVVSNIIAGLITTWLLAQALNKF